MGGRVQRQHRVSCFKGWEGTSCVFEDDAGAQKCAGQLQIDMPDGKSFFSSSLPYNNPKSGNCRLEDSTRKEDAAIIAGMPTSHPITWSLIGNRLDDRYGIFDSPQSNRERALYYLRYGANDWETFPHFLATGGERKCGDGKSKKIPYAPASNGGLLPGDPGLAMERKQCVASDKYEKDPILQDYTFDIAMDRNCFWDSLATFVPQTPYHPLLLPLERPVEILDLGCGIASGAIPLVSYFQQYQDASPGTAPLQIRYTGVDVSEREIEKAKRINPEEFNFVESGAIDYLSKSFPQKLFDVILLRHPGDIKHDWGDDSVMWAQIMRQAWLHLADNGILIVTNYFCFEFHFTKDLLSGILGAQIYVAGLNPSAFASKSSTRDQYLIIAGKQQLW